jgi:hypothetical protein
VPPAHALKCGHVSLHVFPPLCDTAATIPCAPPLFHLSCWNTPMMFLRLADPARVSYRGCGGLAGGSAGSAR